AQAVTAVAVTPATATVSVSATKQFASAASDQFGQPIAAAPSFSWSVSGGGTVSATGLFTAASVAGGPFTVTATASGKSGTAGVTIAAGAAPTVATAASATPSPVTGTTAALSVLGADDGGEANLTYQWTVASGP